MDYTLLFCTLVTIGLILYTFRWIIKGELFHPAFIYSVVNGGVFLIFVFGPYVYKQKIEPIYFFMYVLVISCYVFGIFWGNHLGRKRLSKEFILKPTQLSIYYWSLITFLTLVTVLPTIVDIGSGGLLENAVKNRFETIEANQDVENSNPVVFIFNILGYSLQQISFVIVTAYAIYQKKKYYRIVTLIILAVLLGALQNSRTILLFGLNTVFIPIFLYLKDKDIINFKNIKKVISSLPVMLFTGLTIVFLIFLLTNVRSVVVSDNFNKSLKLLENIYKAEKKDTFAVVTQSFPDSIVNPVLQLSLYAGGTVTFGGIATDIVDDTGLYTWGNRTLNPIHRILDRSGLDGGFTARARKNYRAILLRGPGGFQFSWWGDPANLIVDFGRIGALLMSLLFGVIIGWVYGRSFNSGPVIKSIAHVVIVNSLILTPAVGPFSYFPSAIALIFLIVYLLRSSIKKTRLSSNNYFRI